jgi:hypothetical protein
MSTSIKKMNKALFYASNHLLEASKHLSNVQEFQDESDKLLHMAAEMALIIQPEEEKVSDDRMMSILDEIMTMGKDTQ